MWYSRPVDAAKQNFASVAAVAIVVVAATPEAYPCSLDSAADQSDCSEVDSVD